MSEPEPNPKATAHEDESNPDKQGFQRYASLFVVIVLGCALVGYVRGIKEPPPLARASEPEVKVAGRVPVAVSYSQIAKAPIRVNDNWDNSLVNLKFQKPSPSDPVVRTDSMKLDSLADRSKNRAYDGAPPVIPHPTDQMTTSSCLACHANGIKVGERVATRVSHAHFTNCTQCHVESTRPEFDRFPNATAKNDFAGIFRAGPGGRAGPGAPPTIPHSTWMRHDCASCHGLVARPGIRTTHPWLTNCTQCHAPSAELDQVAFPLAELGVKKP